MSKKKIIAANWKMNLTPSESMQFVEKFLKKYDLGNTVECVIIPSYVSLPACSALLISNMNIRLGAQNVSQYESGAYTGEVNSKMLRDLLVDYVLIGHSERRQLYGETNTIINEKIKRILKTDILPIVCIGETLEERKAGKVEEVIRKQLTEALEGVKPSEFNRFTIAYEPIWAIGTGETATPDQAQEAHTFVRKTLANIWSEEKASKIRIQYGGSVNEKNAQELFQMPDIDGALVGGASLNYRNFYKINLAASNS